MRLFMIFLFIITLNSCIIEKAISRKYEIQPLEYQQCKTGDNIENNLVQIDLEAIYFSPIVISELFFDIKNNNNYIIFFDSTSIEFESNIYDYNLSYLNPKSMNLLNGEEKSLVLSLRVFKNEGREVEHASEEKLLIKLYGYLEGKEKKLLYCAKLFR